MFLKIYQLITFSFSFISFLQNIWNARNARLYSGSCRTLSPDSSASSPALPGHPHIKYGRARTGCRTGKGKCKKFLVVSAIHYCYSFPQQTSCFMFCYFQASSTDTLSSSSSLYFIFISVYTFLFRYRFCSS